MRQCASLATIRELRPGRFKPWRKRHRQFLLAEKLHDDAMHVVEHALQRLSRIDHAEPQRLRRRTLAIRRANALEKVRIFHFYTIGLAAAVGAFHPFGYGQIEKQCQIGFTPSAAHVSSSAMRETGCPRPPP